MAVVLTTAALAACGSTTGDEAPDRADAQTTVPADDTRASGGDTADTTATTPSQDGPADPDRPGPLDDAGGGSRGEGADLADLDSVEVCRLVPAAVVGEALGLAVVETAPGTSPTPQCTYGFTGAGGQRGTATVAALRAGGDLDGRLGAEAFDYTVDLNRRAAGSAVTEIDLDLGDRAVLLSGPNLHLAVVLLGDRVVTALVGATVTDQDAAVALAAATTALAP